jgi:hypothetical protein
MGETEDRLREREQEKAQAVEAIANAIAIIEGDGRPTDLWEKVFLVQGIGMLFRGGYSLATVNAQLALTPVAERSPKPHLPSDPFYDRCDLSLLKAALEEARAEPVREFPQLGPIIFTGQGRA